MKYMLMFWANFHKSQPWYFITHQIAAIEFPSNPKPFQWIWIFDRCCCLPRAFTVSRKADAQTKCKPQSIQRLQSWFFIFACFLRRFIRRSDALGAILVTCYQQLAKFTAVTMAIEYIGKNDKVSWSGHPFSNISVTTSNPRKGRI